MSIDPQTVANAFAALLIGGLVGGFLLFALPATRVRFIAAAPSIAALVAVSASLGSLYFSERAGFVPCELCWYQRIAMYPLAIILPLGAIRRDRDVVTYLFALAATGLVISTYHMQVQWFPERSNSCALNDPCSAKWVEGLGVFTIPQMAAMSFFLLIMLSIASTFAPDDTADASVEELDSRARSVLQPAE